MRFLVKVRINLQKMAEFGAKLQKNELDRSSIISETYCMKDDPAVGVSVWEVENEAEFEKKFAPWRVYYSEVEVREVITPRESMMQLLQNNNKS